MHHAGRSGRRPLHQDARGDGAVAVALHHIGAGGAGERLQRRDGEGVGQAGIGGRIRDHRIGHVIDRGRVFLQLQPYRLFQPDLFIHHPIDLGGLPEEGAGERDALPVFRHIPRLVREVPLHSERVALVLGQNAAEVVHALQTIGEREIDVRPQLGTVGGHIGGILVWLVIRRHPQVVRADKLALHAVKQIRIRYARVKTKIPHDVVLRQRQHRCLPHPGAGAPGGGTQRAGHTQGHRIQHLAAILIGPHRAVQGVPRAKRFDGIAGIGRRDVVRLRQVGQWYPAHLAGEVIGKAQRGVA